MIEEHRRDLTPCGPCRGTLLRRGAKAHAKGCIAGQPPHRVPESADIARLYDQALYAVGRKVRQVACPPANHRQSKRHGLAVDGAERLPHTGENERVGDGVHPGDIGRRQRTVDDDSRSQVTMRQSRPDATRVSRLDLSSADEVKHRGLGRKTCECLQQGENSLSFDPVADTQQCRGSASPEIASSRQDWRNVTAGRHNVYSLTGETQSTQVVGE